MVRRNFKVVGHGDGALAKKAVDLSVRHPNSEIISVDVLQSTYAKYLKKLGLSGKPKNLNVISGQKSASYLEKQKSNSIHHQYAHFSPTSMSFYERRKFFEEVFRTLVKGGKFTIIEGGESGVPLARELKRAGFRVSLVYLTPGEARAVGSPNAKDFANLYGTTFVKDMDKIDPKAKEETLFQIRISREPVQSPEVITYCQDLARRYAKSRNGVNSFVRLIATKPRD